MERQELVLIIEKALSEVLERPVNGLTEETALFDELQLTSLAVLGMLMSVEEATGISVDPEGLDIDDLRTLGSFADFVEAAISEEEAREEEAREEEAREEEGAS
ncbi:phosphopantetheine-binding protein [Streptomyces cyaneofuscatus]|uniref:acyl carrier protein n=1 Tax=Streptomyces cyaneofuscatus TaxID=66883 RepID=UPI00386C95DD|nr:phosphopantetheine-binding protein [Streptomyces cyaneofuscatus]